MCEKSRRYLGLSTNSTGLFRLILYLVTLSDDDVQRRSGTARPTKPLDEMNDPELPHLPNLHAPTKITDGRRVLFPSLPIE